MNAPKVHGPSLTCQCLLSDYEDDEWPDFPGEAKARGPHNGNALETGSLRRYAVRKRCDSVLYNMAVILAAVATGFDIRLSNTTAIHPRCRGGEAGEEEAAVPPTRKRDSFIGNRRDAYLAAVRDSFIEPEPNFHECQNTAGYPHNTFHGVQTRYRPSVNFEVPIRFTESMEGYPRPPSEVRTTPSTTDSTSPRKSSRSSDTDCDVALISLSPSQDKAFAEYQRQLSDTSSSVFETPKTTPSKTTPQRFNVKFEDSIKQSPSTFSHRRSPSNTSSSSNPSHTHSHHSHHSHDHVAKYTDSFDMDNYRQPSPNVIRPPPRRPSATEQHGTPHGTPERPVTLDIIPRPRPFGILKKTSPVHMANRSPRTRATPTPQQDGVTATRVRATPTPSESSSINPPPRSRTTPTPSENIVIPRGRVTPTPSDSTSAFSGDDQSFVSARSAPSPGSTPPHIDHQKTLLDIDVDGQRDDYTRPLPAKRPPVLRHPTINEHEFLQEQ